MKACSKKCTVLVASFLIFLPAVLWAKVDLVTLPLRDRVQLTIYNSADLTLVRDIRALTMKKGFNRLQFSWANTFIDPTSLEIQPLAQARKIAVHSIEYPPRVVGLGIWNIESDVAETVPFEITSFASGVSWQAYYLATLNPDESAMRLEGYVRITNNSGEDFENAETRLVVGEIHQLDEIAELARRQWPYGRPGMEILPMMEADAAASAVKERYMGKAKALLAAEARPREIQKEGLSEYFLYTIEGKEDIASGWGQRLVSFVAGDVAVKNLYRYEEEAYGSAPVRFLAFANDRAHKLGLEPIPNGLVKVFRRLGDQQHLSYVGHQTIKYIPKGEEVALNLGASEDVSVKAKVMEAFTDYYEWKDDNITGWDEHITCRIEVSNSRDIPVNVEIRRNFPVTAWELTNEGDYGTFAKVDKDTVQYALELPPHGKSQFTYRLVLHQGTRGR